MITRTLGKLSDGRSAGLYILRSRKGMEVHLTDYGAAIVRIVVPDRKGERRDVVLGYDDAAGYECGQSYFGATVGRYANRISDAAFDLNGRHYVLTANDGPNCLHGGRDPYNHRMWAAVIPFGSVSSGDIAASYALESMNDWSSVNRKRNTKKFNAITDEQIEAAGTDVLPGSSAGQSECSLVSGVAAGAEGSSGAAGEVDDNERVTFVLESPDGDQGFPGRMHIEVTYTLTSKNELHIDYRAQLRSEVGTARRETAAGKTDSFVYAVPVNLTNHSYFNLNGHDSGSVLDHIVWIDADSFTETDHRLIPTGELLDVERTPLDFRQAKPLAQDIGADYEPLRFAGGYDHNFALNHAEQRECAGSTDAAEVQPGGWRKEYRKVASVYAEDSGIRMTVATDLPGMQLYTSNGLGGEPGKDGAVYGKRSAVCLETQFWPDTVSRESFPGGLAAAGEDFTSRTTYSFSTEK